MRNDALKLAAGDLNAEIRPDVGGSVAGFWSQGRDGPVDWLRRAPAAATSAGDMASYPLVPFSNRIRNGRFTFAGETVELPLNFRPHPHVIHGHGWQAPWTVVDATDCTASLEYRHDADAWPWPYLAGQRFTLSDGALEILISLTNTGERPMPAGIGLHPYFPRSPKANIRAELEGLWRADAEVMPTELVPAATVWPPASPLVPDAVALDNCFTGWGKSVEIAWPETGHGLTMTAEGPLGFLIVFTPAGEPFFCAEPVSHCVDAVNLAGTRDDTGLVALAPGERLAATVRFAPQPVD